jgi:hypothetical protein
LGVGAVCDDVLSGGAVGVDFDGFMGKSFRAGATSAGYWSWR